MRDPSALEAPERAHLQWLCQQHATLDTMYSLIQDFRHMLHHREGCRLEAWIQTCQVTKIPELVAFVEGLRRDWNAVVAGLTEAESNGMVEGFVNKLKVLKRMMYGRAGFPLLRQRVLHAA